jgi:hypothetical protein
MSNLYMTTEEFADMVVQALHDQNYFKKGGKHHPGDIVIAFTSAAESIASALEWAITQEGKVRKEQEQKKAVMRATTLAKNTSGSWSSQSIVLPEDEEIAPNMTTTEWELGYSEWQSSKKAK